MSVCARSVSACTTTILQRARPWPPRWCRLCFTVFEPHVVRTLRCRTGCMHVADAAQGPTKPPAWCLCTCIAICSQNSVSHGDAFEPAWLREDVCYITVFQTREGNVASAVYAQVCTSRQKSLISGTCRNGIATNAPSSKFAFH